MKILHHNLSSEEITKAVDELLKEYYLSLRYIPIALGQILRRHGLDEARRLFYSARMFLRYIRRAKNEDRVLLYVFSIYRSSR